MPLTTTNPSMLPFIFCAFGHSWLEICELVMAALLWHVLKWPTLIFQITGLTLMQYTPDFVNMWRKVQHGRKARNLVHIPFSGRVPIVVYRGPVRQHRPRQLGLRGVCGLRRVLPRPRAGRGRARRGDGGGGLSFHGTPRSNAGPHSGEPALFDPWPYYLHSH